MKRNTYTSFATLAIVAAAASAHADFAFNNFDGSGGANWGIGWTVSGTSSDAGGYNDDAEQFQSATTGVVTEIDAAVGIVTGTNSLIVSLYTDAGGSLGSLMDTWTVNGAM